MGSRIATGIAFLTPALLVFACATGTDDSVGTPSFGGSGATDGSATGGNGGTATGGVGASGGFGGGGFGGGGFGGNAGAATGGTGGAAGSGGATGGSGGATGGSGGATGGSGGSTGGSGGSTGGAGGSTGGSGGSTGGSGGSTGGTGGTAGCPGTTVNGTCVYLADKTGLSLSSAQGKCTSLGSGWDLCTPTVLCDSATLTYLGTAGCDCNGGSTACACGYTNNLYIHVKATATPYYVRTKLVPNCDWTSDACTDSVSETCGAALCCK